MSKTTLQGRADDIADSEVDDQPNIRKIKRQIAEKTAAYDVSCKHARAVDQRIAKAREDVEEKRHALATIEQQLPVLAARGLLESGAAQVEFVKQVKCMKECRQFLQQFELAEPHFQMLRKAANSPVAALAEEINLFEEKLAKERQRAKLEMARTIA